jgi:hypothetical protein
MPEPEKHQPVENKHPYLFYWLTGGLATILAAVIAISVALSSGGSGGSSAGSGSSSGGSSQASLNKALLPPQTLGSATIVKTTSTDVSQVIGICGGAISSTPRFASGELLENNQSGIVFAENIIYWPSASDAAQAITNDTTTVSQNSAGCSYSSNGVTEEFTQNFSGSPPQGCGQYLATDSQLSTASYFGSRVETQCGTYTIEIDYLVSTPQFNSVGTVDGYLNNAVGRFMTVLRTE